MAVIVIAPQMFRTKRNPLAPPKAPKQSRVGKTGTVRLVGVDMSKLREQAYLRSGGFCEIKLPGCNGYTPWKAGELSHIRTKRNGGDVISNVRWACPNCHRLSHNCNGKPCPPKASEVER